MNVLPAFEHEGPFVSQLKSSLAPGRGGGGVCRDRNSVAWSEAWTRLRRVTAFRVRPLTSLMHLGTGLSLVAAGYILFDPIITFYLNNKFTY